jgi:endoribonuclease LACTB2
VTESVTIVNVGYRSTNYWVISAGRSRLLVDLGWPGTLGKLQANLRRVDVPPSEIRYGFATHYHPDHAGLAQELKNSGMRLLITEEQLAWAPKLASIVKPADGYVDLQMHDNQIVSCAESRAALAAAGFAGQFVHTPGHSDDSVSLLLDDGSAFTGDLTPPGFAEAQDVEVVDRSWRQLRTLGATTIYPGHGPVRPLR